MINRFCTSALWECNKMLIAVAQGNLPADLVVRHVRRHVGPARDSQRGRACGGARDDARRAAHPA